MAARSVYNRYQHTSQAIWNGEGDRERAIGREGGVGMKGEGDRKGEIWGGTKRKRGRDEGREL